MFGDGRHAMDHLAQQQANLVVVQQQGIIVLEIGDATFRTTWDVLRGSAYRYTSDRCTSGGKQEVPFSWTVIQLVLLN